MYKDLNLMFGDIFVAVAIMVSLSSLLKLTEVPFNH